MPLGVTPALQLEGGAGQCRHFSPVSCPTHCFAFFRPLLQSEGDFLRRGVREGWVHPRLVSLLPFSICPARQRFVSNEILMLFHPQDEPPLQARLPRLRR